MNELKTTLPLSLLTVLMVTMGSAVGGKSGMVFAFTMALGMNFFSHWFSDKIVLTSGGAHRAAGSACPLPQRHQIFAGAPLAGAQTTV